MLKTDILNAKKNIKIYKLKKYINCITLTKGILVLYYHHKGLSFLEIALLQSIGSIATVILEIPTGYMSDKYGHSLLVKVSAVAGYIALCLLLIANSFNLLLVSELFTCLSMAASSGAGTALFYDSLTTLGKKDQFIDIVSKINGRTSLMGIGATLLAPIVFSYSPDFPYKFSLFITAITLILTFKYKDSIKRKENEKQKNSNNEKLTLKEKLIILIKDNKTFIGYSLLSAFVILSLSNYSQFLGPFLNKRGLDLKLLGFITASAKLASYLGTKLSMKLKKINRVKTLFILAFSVFIFIAIGGLKGGIIVGVLGYFGINLMSTPFFILLSDSINEVVDDKYRATLLSISNQFDEAFFIIFDPIIGYCIDKSGFGRTYLYLGFFSSIILVLVKIVLQRNKK